MTVLRWSRFVPLPVVPDRMVDLSPLEAALLLSATLEISSSYNWVATPQEYDTIEATLSTLMAKIGAKGMGNYAKFDIVQGSQVDVTHDWLPMTHSAGESWFISQAGDTFCRVPVSGLYWWNIHTTFAYFTGQNVIHFTIKENGTGIQAFRVEKELNAYPIVSLSFLLPMVAGRDYGVSAGLYASTYAPMTVASFGESHIYVQRAA